MDSKPPAVPFLGCGQPFWNDFFTFYKDEARLADWVEFAVGNPYIYGIFIAHPKSEEYELVYAVEKAASQSGDYQTMSLYDFFKSNGEVGKVWGGLSFERDCPPKDDEEKKRAFFQKHVGSYIVKEQVKGSQEYFLVVCYDLLQCQATKFDVSDFVQRAKLYAYLWKPFMEKKVSSVATVFLYPGNKVQVKMGFGRAGGFYYGDYAGEYYQLLEGASGDLDKGNFQVITEKSYVAGGFSKACWTDVKESNFLESFPELKGKSTKGFSGEPFENAIEIKEFGNYFETLFGKSLADAYKEKMAKIPEEKKLMDFSFTQEAGGRKARFTRTPQFDDHFTADGKYLCVSYSENVFTVFSLPA